MKPAVGQRTAQGYESALEHLGHELRPTLHALDEAAADPFALDEYADDLPVLQYALHLAAERVRELPPAAGAEEEHRELGAALAIARDETADVAAALEEHGTGYAAALVWEWRVAIFGVRIALHRADGEHADPELAHELGRPYLPVVLIARSAWPESSAARSRSSGRSGRRASCSWGFPPASRTAARNAHSSRSVHFLKVRKSDPPDQPDPTARQREPLPEVPSPTPSYRRRSWLEFQRALDPLAAPKRLRPPPS